MENMEPRLLSLDEIPFLRSRWPKRDSWTSYSSVLGNNKECDLLQIQGFYFSCDNYEDFFPLASDLRKNSF